MGGDPTEQQRRLVVTGLAVVAWFLTVQGARAAVTVANAPVAVQLAPAYTPAR